MTTTFEYGTTRLRDVKINTRANSLGRNEVLSLELGGEVVEPSNRFWHSLRIRFGFTPNIFKYFDHAEVFTRISQRSNDDQLNYCVEHDPQAKQPTLLAVTNPKMAVVTHANLMDLLGQSTTEEHSYHNGVVRSTHAPRYAAPYQISGDEFRSKFVIDTPIDGFGRPAIYLSLLRQICANGAIAFAPAFRSELNIGKGSKAREGATFALVRALEGFNNEEGFAALRQRFESATRSWASVAEVNQAYKTLLKLASDKEVSGKAPIAARGGDGASEYQGNTLFRSFHSMTGDMTSIYGLANLDALSVKRQRTLPTPAGFTIC